ncbi:MAG: aminotransferase [Alphaproteobacteria bacterium]|nr:aminotransferase [Alphaproteobacteria bacterium]
MKPGNSILSSYGTTIFETMSRLAAQHQAVNLGQGFPEGLECREVIEACAAAVLKGPHQYPSMMGTPDLRQAIALHAKRFYDLDVDWQSEVMVTSGATEALADCLLGLIEPGDEVVLIEPLYDSYLPIIRRAGGIPKLVRLSPPLWELPREELAKAFSDKTKLILLNTPMNPAARVFDLGELQFIADLVIKHDAYAVCDEVYEHLIYDGLLHVPLITLPGMRERCARIGSAGKIFSLTGWKIGWVVAAPKLLQPIVKAHQFVTFTTPPMLQDAVAFGLSLPDSFFAKLKTDLAARRDKLKAGLQRIGFKTLEAKGSYFLSADFRPLGYKGADADFCRYITEQAKVTAIPVSAFYQDDPPDHFARFCFAKKDEAIDEALARLQRFFGEREC